ncbi:hypothetical protein [Limnohabitans sp.]|uniref:hypothetical protein n=1 Tax=Limnohabitans sp. TaxID=1907725 RepID=UPI00286F33F6|nr:hypothetical protein [Limnohabitans sp.]
MSGVGQVKLHALLWRKADKQSMQKMQDTMDAQEKKLTNVSEDTFKNMDSADFSKVVRDAYNEGAI